MNRCMLCGEPTLGAEGLCTYHTRFQRDDWATGNRIICDFLHRGILLGNPTPTSDPSPLGTTARRPGPFH
jgi:hypothetical protein